MVRSVNELHRLGVSFQWSIVIDCADRDTHILLKNHIAPSLLPNCNITLLENHRGQSACRNIGVKELDCEYVCWLDADDMLDSRNLSRLVTELSTKEDFYWNNYDLVFTDSYDCDSDISVVAIRKKGFIYGLHKEHKNTLLDPLLGVDFVYQMQFLKRDTFLSLGGFNERLMVGEDVDLVLRLSEISRDINFFHIPIPAYYYRDNPNGICGTRWEELKRAMEAIYLKSAQRQNLPVSEFRFVGAFRLCENMFQYVSYDQKGDVSLYDVYLNVAENGQIVPRPYIDMPGMTL
jgi:glycosyltransferase involved in cell wall biosynthesis